MLGYNLIVGVTQWCRKPRDSYAFEMLQSSYDDSSGLHSFANLKLST